MRLIENSLFNYIVKSLKEIKEHMEGKKKLKTRKVNTAERPNYKAEKIEDEDAIDLKLIEEYE